MPEPQKFSDILNEPPPPNQGGRFSGILSGEGRQAAPEVAESPGPQVNVGGTGMGTLRSIFQGLTFGAGDEIVAAGAAGLSKVVGPNRGRSFRELFDAYLAAERDRIGQFRETNPKLAIGAEVAGAIPTALVPLGAIGRAAQGGKLLSKIRAGGAIGAVEGGVFGFSAGEGGLAERGKSAAVGAGLGLVTGVSAPAVGAGVRKVAQARRSGTRAVIKGAPTTVQLREAADAAFEKAKAAGVQIPKVPFRKVVADIMLTASDEGLDPTLHPRATAALKRLAGAADDPDPTKITTLRRIVSAAAGSTDADERRIALIMLDQLDDFAENQMGSGRGLAEARVIWGRMRRSEMLDQMIEKARTNAPNFSASGFENALRTQFRQLINNPRRMRGFNKAERAAIRKVAKGGPVGNALRMLGKLAPRGVVSAGVGGMAGAAIAGPVGVAAVMGAGEVGRMAATAATRRNALKARALVASGGEAVQTVAPRNALVDAADPRLAVIAETLLQRNAPVTAPIRERIIQRR